MGNKNRGEEMSFFTSKTRVLLPYLTLSLSALCLMLVFQNCQGMQAASQDQYVLGEYLVLFKDSASTMSAQKNQ